MALLIQLSGHAKSVKYLCTKEFVELTVDLIVQVAVVCSAVKVPSP